MAADSATSSSELPECPVCHDGYTEPKILPCTHLVCKKCFVSWLQKAGVKEGCPLCRAPILPSTSQGQSQITKPTTTPTTLHQPTQPAPATTTATSATTPRTAHKPSGAELARVLKVGDRVKPGPSKYHADLDMKGTVTAIPSSLAVLDGGDPEGLVDVLWDDGLEHWCWMGRNGWYHLDLL